MATKAKRPNRRPVELEMVGGKSSRQRIWEAIRAKRERFTRYNVSRRADVDDLTAQTYLLALLKGGFIEQTNTTVTWEEKEYRLVKDYGLEAPRLDRQGRPVIQGQGQEQMWRTMRIMSSDFNASELAGFATMGGVEIKPNTARDYIKHLHHAGYLTITNKGPGRGNGGPLTRYRLPANKYTGPRPPKVQRTKSVYDPNTNEVVWTEAASDDDI